MEVNITEPVETTVDEVEEPAESFGRQNTHDLTMHGHLWLAVFLIGAYLAGRELYCYMKRTQGRYPQTAGIHSEHEHQPHMDLDRQPAYSKPWSAS